jgi:ribonuclease P protein component
VRRRLRELVRLDRSRLLPGFWFTLVARAAAATVDFATLQNEWRRLAKRAGLLVLTD